MCVSIAISVCLCCIHSFLNILSVVRANIYSMSYLYVYPFSLEGGINLLGDPRGSILSKRAETSQEGVIADANMKRFQHKVL